MKRIKQEDKNMIITKEDKKAYAEIKKEMLAQELHETKFRAAMLVLGYSRDVRRAIFRVREDMKFSPNVFIAEDFLHSRYDCKKVKIYIRDVELQYSKLSDYFRYSDLSPNTMHAIKAADNNIIQKANNLIKEKGEKQILSQFFKKAQKAR